MIRMLEVSRGSYHVGDGQTCEEFAQYQFGLVSVDENVSNFYEAIAIWSFSRLCILVVRQHSGPGATFRRALGQIITQGIMAYVFILGFATVSRLSLATFPIWTLRVLHLVDVNQSLLEGALIGMDFVGSCLAIWNIASFEKSCEELFVEVDFHAASKFISVKVLVSVSFFQGVLANLWAYYTNASLVERHLVQASFTVHEMLLLALWHGTSNCWGGSEGWYDKVGHNTFYTPQAGTYVHPGDGIDSHGSLTEALVHST